LSSSNHLRADAARNRDRLINVVRKQFSKRDSAVTLEEIAQLAAVGIGTLSGPPIDTRAKIRTAIARFLAAGVADGTIRNDVGEDDLTVSLAATVLATNLAVDQDQLRRILDLLMDGLRPRAETPIAVEQLKRPVDETAIPRLSKRKSMAPGKRSQRR
jgi:hypothetical protein